MGLDMYLYKKHYIGNKWREPEEQVKVTVPSKQEKATFRTGPIKSERITEISEEVAYWRKANAIHQWFVENVQNGVDECKPHYVSREQLAELRDLCLRVLAAVEVETRVEVYDQYTPDGMQAQERTVRVILNPDDVADTLPTTEGFFFGSTDYDEWYLLDLENTVKQIDRVLTMPEEWDLEYQSSW